MAKYQYKATYATSELCPTVPRPVSTCSTNDLVKLYIQYMSFLHPRQKKCVHMGYRYLRKGTNELTANTLGRPKQFPVS